MIRSIVLAAMLMLSSTVAMAQVASTPNPCDNLAQATAQLSQNDTAALLRSCREATGAMSGKLATVTPVEANQWAEAAKGIAGAIGIAASQLGIATNEFLNSPAGVLVAALLIFNFGGGAVFAVLFSALSLMFAVIFFLRVKVKTREYTLVPVLWGAFSIRRTLKVVNRDEIGEGFAIMTVITYAVILLLNLMVWMNIT